MITTGSHPPRRRANQTEHSNPINYLLKRTLHEWSSPFATLSGLLAALRSQPQQNWGFLFPNMSHQKLSVSPQLAVELQVSVWNIKHVRLSSNYPEIGGSNLTCCVKDNWFAVAKFTNSLPIYLIILFGSKRSRVEIFHSQGYAFCEGKKILDDNI